VTALSPAARTATSRRPGVVFWIALLSLPAVCALLPCVRADDDAGLALELSLDRGTASRDEPVQFTVQLTNTGGEPLTVQRWRQTDHTLEIKDRVGNVWPMKT
jgi:hypothetical protein